MWGGGGIFFWGWGGELHGLLEAFRFGVLGFCKLSQHQTLTCFAMQLWRKNSGCHWKLPKKLIEGFSGLVM